MKDFIKNKLLPSLKERIRPIDYFAIRSTIEDCDTEIISELKAFQNTDGGFGNALEPDSRMPESSILATRAALHYFKYIKNKNLLQDIKVDIVRFFENNYDSLDKRFYLNPSSINNYPRAFWWNYENLKEWFSYGNPEGEVLGFLYENKNTLSHLDLDTLIMGYVGYINSEEFLKGELHHTLNALYFYHSVDQPIKDEIHEAVYSHLDKLLTAAKDNWDDYVFEPYKAFILNQNIMNGHPLLNRNLSYIENKILQMKVFVPWEWNQFEDVFESIKDEWLGYLYAEMVYALFLAGRITD